MELGVEQQLARAETLVSEAMCRSVDLKKTLDEVDIFKLKYAISNTIKANYPDPTKVSFEVDMGGTVLQPVVVVNIDPPIGLEKIDVELDLSPEAAKSVDGSIMVAESWKKLWET